MWILTLKYYVLSEKTAQTEGKCYIFGKSRMYHINSILVFNKIYIYYIHNAGSPTTCLFTFTSVYGAFREGNNRDLYIGMLSGGQCDLNSVHKSS